jgi:hypothetical protein
MELYRDVKSIAKFGYEPLSSEHPSGHPSIHASIVLASDQTNKPSCPDIVGGIAEKQRLSPPRSLTPSLEKGECKSKPKAGKARKASQNHTSTNQSAGLPTQMDPWAHDNPI